MTRLTDLEASKAKHERDIAVYDAVPDKKKTPEQWRKLAINQRSLLDVIAELATNIEGPSDPPPAPPVEPPVTPPVSGDAAALSRAWQSDKAGVQDNIKGAIQRAGYQPVTTDQWIAAVGEGLYGQYLALGYAGQPGNSNVPIEQFEALTKPYGGLWFAFTDRNYVEGEGGADDPNGQGDYTVDVWQNNVLVARLRTPMPATTAEANKFVAANGLNAEWNGPA